MAESSSFYDSETNQDQVRYNLTMAIAELQSKQKALEQELGDIKIKLEANNISAGDQLRNLEKSLQDVRDKAIDAMHISVGVDGQNGIRGDVKEMSAKLSTLSESLYVLRQTANSYVEIKSLVLRLFVASAMTILCQFGAAVWLVSSLHSRQESMREDINRVLLILDRRQEPPSKALLK
jgi:hypothetical protein